jgi:hypothetical protein
MSDLLDAIDKIGNGRHFVEAVYLAVDSACPEPSHRNALTATCDAAERQLKEAQEMLEQLQATSPRRTSSNATNPKVSDGAKIHSAKLTLASARALAHALTLMAPKAAPESTDDEEAIFQVAREVAGKISQTEDLLATIDL